MIESFKKNGVSSHEDESPKEKKLSRLKKILGIGALAGGLALAGDQALDQYQETQDHKEREEKRKRNIEMTEEDLKNSTHNLLKLDASPQFQETINNGPDSSIAKSIDSLESLLQDLEDQKKSGNVDFETILHIKNLTENLQQNVDSLDNPELASAISSVQSSVEGFSKIEQVKEMVGYIDDFLELLKDEKFIKSISKHPAATKRVVESVEKYKEIFAGYYIDPNVADQKFASLVDSIYSVGNQNKNKRIQLTLMAMQRDGVLNDFFESLGQKINTVLISNTFKGKISISKNFAEYSGQLFFNLTKENEKLVKEFIEEFGIYLNQEDIVNWFEMDCVYGIGRGFFSLFSHDNLEAIELITRNISKSKDLSDQEKEIIISSIMEFGENIRNLSVSLEENK